MQSSRVTMPPSNFGARASTAIAWHARALADRLRAGIEHEPQERPGVVRRAADDEVVGGVAPRLAQPRRGWTRIRPTASTTARAAHDRRSPPSTRTTAASKRPSASSRLDDLGVVRARRCPGAPPPRSSCSSAPCRRRGRTRSCARAAACPAATTETARRAAAIHSGHSADRRTTSRASASSVLPLTRSRSARNSSSG